MAIDGVNIIDADTAHDTYWGVMDLYDSGAHIDIILKEFPLIEIAPYDDFDNEIYTTACGLAYWEIGQMTIERLNYIKLIIDRGVCVKEWTNQDKKKGVARQKALDKYLKKISIQNDKVRARKKFRKISNVHFQPDDVLTFKLRDGNYRVSICILVDQCRGHCDYILVPTTYNSSKKPTINDLYDKEIFGGTTEASSYSREQILARQPHINRIWKLVGGNPNFLFGVYMLSIPHKSFINFKDKFENIGTLQIIESFKNLKGGGYAETFSEIEERYIHLDKPNKSHQMDKYPVSILCDF